MKNENSPPRNSDVMSPEIARLLLHPEHRQHVSRDSLFDAITCLLCNGSDRSDFALAYEVNEALKGEQVAPRWFVSAAAGIIGGSIGFIILQILIAIDPLSLVR